MIGAQMCFATRDGEYDQRFEESVAGLVYCDGDQKTLYPLKGVRE
jgi:hypothetical protein